MSSVLNFVFVALSCVAAGLLVAYLVILVVSSWKKSAIRASFQVQCSSGDSEVMVLNYNFTQGESEESKKEKLDEAFGYVEARREANHQKWLDVQAKAIQENQGKTPEDLKLRSVTEQSPA